MAALSYRGLATINVRQSAATGAGVTVWGLWNPTASGITTRITNLWLRLFFDGAAVATLMKYELRKLTGATAFSGGATALAHKVTGAGGAALTVCQTLDTGLTQTGATLAGNIWTGAMGRVTQTTTLYQESQTWLSWSKAPMELAEQEILGIRNAVLSVIGDNIIGVCEFEEWVR